MVVVSAGRRRSAPSVRSTTSARTRRRRRRCPRRCDPTCKCRDGQQQRVARDDQNALGQTVAGGLERRRRETDRFDQHVTDTNERAVIETRIFGQFSGQKRADRDTTKRRLSSPLRQPYCFFFEDFFAFFFAGIRESPPSGHALHGYIDTLTSQMSTEPTGKSSSGRRGNVAP